MTTVFTSGCFDCLHKGHLHLLGEARKLGDKLVVGVNDDEYCRRKGPGRPIWGVSERIRGVLEAGADQAMVIGESPLQAIISLKPSYIVVGSDYDLSRVVGAEEAKQWGGRVVIVERLPGISTTEILAHYKIGS